ncbi:hypothetical protein BT96DRAFT_1010367 [Gymnopus androsaceus JB14]|uniref:Uncharacterized protein n=1 Tax=Gymnopus androsaceus JB14 TaxID=1447944 RepID=A0A6A4GAT0_9AGAR|nr:hypothetical protein BT96DRAFT_1010367 [Gymnopus androsaceus JB14]
MHHDCSVLSSVISLWCDATNSEAAKSSKDLYFTAILWTKLMRLAYLNAAKLKLKINYFPPQIVNKKEKPEDLVILDLFLKGPDSI